MRLRILVVCGLCLAIILSGCKSRKGSQSLLEKPVEELTAKDMARMQAVIETSQGVLKFRFFPEDAPNHCRNFIKLAKSGFYDGLTFHRVIKGFMIQGGDPRGDGSGGPGYTINAEFNSRPHLQGTVSMARTPDPNSAGSQFFICLEPQPGLDRQYTVFGQLTEGLDVLLSIGSTPTTGPNGSPPDRPLKPVVMKKVHIEIAD